MAEDEEGLTADEKVQRSVSRSLRRIVTGSVLLVVAGSWGWMGYYELRPGEAAIVLRLGKHVRTVVREGPHFRIPPPIETVEIENVDDTRKEEFGFAGKENQETPHERIAEASMQTSDNNIVRVNFAVQYRIKDAFAVRYRLADPDMVVRDAAQAAMREVVGRETVDGVLRERRDAVTAEVQDLMERLLDSYDAGIQIKDVQLLDVRAPEEVQSAFDDVIAANQDAKRLVNEAEAHRNELIPRARAQRSELVADAEAYRASKIAEAEGAARRFTAIFEEYRKAPEVTRRRLYLETMEIILPDVEKIVIESGTTQILPYLPLGSRSGGAPK
ncbi:MAG: FtsH protease activity modulator HflK [Myxococcales bacterium]|nr:FtsH protease activity modulator HflK [Myxococcales bacterium]